MEGTPPVDPKDQQIADLTQQVADLQKQVEGQQGQEKAPGPVEETDPSYAEQQAEQSKQGLTDQPQPEPETENPEGA